MHWLRRAGKADMEVNINLVLNLVLTLLFMLIVGFIARKTGIIDDRMSKGLSNLIIKIGQPFMIVGALIKIEFSMERLKTGLLVVVISMAVHLVLALLAYVIAKPFRDLDERKIYEFSLIFANCGFIGFPIMEAAFGDIGLFYGAFYIISFNLFTWSYGIMIFGRKRSDIRISPKKLLVNFGTIPCIIGFVLFCLPITLPAPVLSTTNFLGSICTPISTLIIGGLLATRTVKELLLSWKTYLFCICRLLLLPVIVVFIAKLCGLDNTMIYLCAIMSGLPTAANTAMFAEIYNVRPSLAAQTVGMSSLFSAATIPVVVLLARLIIGLW